MSTLSGQVTSVTFDSPIRVAYGKVLVQPPHWSAGVRSDADGSTRPAAFLAGAAGSATVVLELTGTGGGVGTLRTTLGALDLAGQVSLVDGVQSVTVAVNQIGSAISRHTGDAAWRIESGAGAVLAQLANSTRLEVFVVLAQPTALYNPQGVWSEVLRFLVANVVDGVANPQAAVAAITRYCHGSLGLRYDAINGASPWGLCYKGGSFQLGAFLGGALPVCCFDLAAGLISLCGAIGIDVTWQSVTFGYLRQTDLIGIGQCNNPFFASPNYSHAMVVVPPNGPGRSFFSMHGFGKYAGMIYDACAGPHLGTEDPGTYLTNAVDSVPPPPFPPRLAVISPTSMLTLV